MSEKEPSKSKSDYFVEIFFAVIVGIFICVFKLPYFIAENRCDKDLDFRVLDVKANWSMMIYGESSDACKIPVVTDPRKKYPVKERKFENSH